MTTNEIVKKIRETYYTGGIVYVGGNGGSSAEADHMVSEFVTHGIRAVSLNNPATITALANDYSYDQVFLRQLITMACHNIDLFIGLSTSGKSKNIVKTYEFCKKYHMDYIDWPRKGKDTAAIQEYQLKLMHKVYKKLIK